VTESDWEQATDPHAMIALLRDERKPFRTRWLGWLSVPRFRVSERKWKLFWRPRSPGARTPACARGSRKS
jgi:hypothetical protein